MTLLASSEERPGMLLPILQHTEQPVIAKTHQAKILTVLCLRPWSYMLYISAEAFVLGVLRIP